MKSFTSKESQIDTNRYVIDVGKNVEKVSQLNPHWEVNDWCRYFDREIKREYKKLGIDCDWLLKDCGTGCKCGH